MSHASAAEIAALPGQVITWHEADYQVAAVHGVFANSVRVTTIRLAAEGGLEPKAEAVRRFTLEEIVLRGGVLRVLDSQPFSLRRTPAEHLDAIVAYLERTRQVPALKDKMIGELEYRGYRGTGQLDLLA